MNERFARAGAIARIDLTHEPDFTLGSLEVRPSLREIAGAGWLETIDPRVMRVLVALARANGRAVSRGDLIESCWDGIVVGEDAISRCISRLRKVAEASSGAFAVESIPRVGYRLKVAEAREANSFGARASTPAPPVIGTWRAWRPALPGKSAVAVFVLIAVGFVLWRFWPETSSASVDASVAVLPFVNMSSDPKENYFSDGFSEELINDLTNEPHLLVASRTSSFAFKGRNESIKVIAGALDVHAVVEGSVREVGDRIRITAQLINASNGYHLWSADYTRDLTDVLSLQDDLARAIAAQLTHRLVSEPSVSRPKIDPAVYRLYLQGLYQFHTPAPQGWRRALTIFQQVAAEAPDFADDFAWLAGSAANLAFNSDPAPASDFAIASSAAQRALSLDPHNMLARFVHGGAELGTWNWRAAASDFRILQRQNPNSFWTIVALWNYYELLGLPDKAFAEWGRLSMLEPKTYSDSLTTLWALDLDGRFQDELRVAQAQLLRHPRDAYRLMSVCSSYALTGQIAEARVVEERARSLLPDSSSDFYFQNCELAIDRASGNRADIMKLLQLWESQFPDKFQHPAWIAANYVLLGDFDDANDWLERAYEVREPTFFGNFYRAGSGRGFDYEKAIATYRQTPGYKALAAKPLFKAWQAEHDRIAAALVANKVPLALP